MSSRWCLENWQGRVSRQGSQDTVYPFREHLNSVQRMVSGGYCEGLFPDTVCWTQLRNTWERIPLRNSQEFPAITVTFGTSLALYRGQKGLSLENPQKESEKGFPGPLGPRAEKARNRVENDNFSSFFRVSGSFSTLFRVFSAPGPRGPGNPFSDSLLGFSREGPF